MLPTNHSDLADLRRSTGSSGSDASGNVMAFIDVHDVDTLLRGGWVHAGPPTKDQLAHVQPARFMHHLHPSASTVRFHAGTPAESLAGRSLMVPCGQCLGGGSSVNFAMYSRGSASDFDDWETIHKNPGWGSKDLLPLMKKTETYQVKPDALNHGYAGPLKVSNGGIYTNVGQQYLDVATRFDTARKAGEDVNDLVSVNIYGRWQKWIDKETGKRSDVPHHFIYNQQETTPNLHIVTGVLVKRVLFDGNRATGVEYGWNLRHYPDQDNTLRPVHAKKLVVLSAGTFGSPGILERSGVGRKSVLEPLSIPPLVELDGVGESYQDHNVIFAPYLAAPEADTLDAVARNDTDSISALSGEWFKNGQGLMAHNGIDIGVKMRPNSVEELAEFGPEFKKRWDTYFERAPDKPVIWMGQVAIIADVKPMMWGYKMTREIARRMPLFEGEYAPMHPVFPPGSKAGILEGPPVPFDTPRVVYTEDDDKAIELYTRQFVSTAWHSLGTCAMKPREEGGVVDPRLNVYGLEGIKVCDISIAPSNVGANTYATALTIGEKAALILAEEFGIEGV
ncbi:hypothetical protein EWM64_g151 [Hericium alpestre]|uniref:Glucose-methanol-choline oxidoreductase N-terminal domain-containing protein n=1 Tax=Hericium alpestre TaxID=135208 RepID=A0A4Z0AC36_9AGAM|nr:hypothetical protein EWM64_g151 [Hericium alpestre]